MRDLLFKLEKIASGGLLAILSGTIFVQVLSRFLFNFPLAWSEETSRYSFIWLTMIAAPICIRLRANISMDVVSRHLPRYGVILLEIVGAVLVLIFSIVLLVWGLKILGVVNSQSSPAIGIPMLWVYAAIPTGAALMIVELAASLSSSINDFRQLKSAAK